MALHTDDSMVAHEPPFAPGGRIGRYELALLVRDDDAGSTWLAREKTATGSERLVALRTPLPRLAADERFRALLRQEVKLATGVAHPNVAQVLGMAEDTALVPTGPIAPRREAFVVTSEWVDGETFADLRAAARAKRVRIPQAIALRVLADACAGLHSAHLLRDRNGGLLNVVHGDVSPKSIVIAGSGEARIIDLGFMKAKARHSGGANHAWSMDGRSPPGQRIDRHADVWGIGAILADVLADYADAPASSRSGAAVQVARPHSSPSSESAAVPSLVSEIVVRARSLDPLERFATAAEMQGAIEAAMMTLGIATSHATVSAFARGLVGDRTLARAEALRAARAKAPVVFSIPTPAVDSVPATVQSLRAARDPAESSESRILKPPPLPRVIRTPPPGPAPVIMRRPSRGDTGSAVSHTPVRESFGAGASGYRRKGALIAAGSALGLLAFAASAHFAIRSRSPVVVAAAPVSAVAPISPPDAPPLPALRPTCPSGMVEVSPAAGVPSDAPRAFCVDSAPVTTEAYKACSDAGDCKRAATENRWPGITAKEQAAADPLCRERDPRVHAKEPVNCVDREMAAVYCKARGLRLPTEAEGALVIPDASARPASRNAGSDSHLGFSEWSQRPAEPPTNRSSAIGFRCARSL